MAVKKLFLRYVPFLELQSPIKVLFLSRLPASLAYTFGVQRLIQQILEFSDPKNISIFQTMENISNKKVLSQEGVQIHRCVTPMPLLLGGNLLTRMHSVQRQCQKIPTLKLRSHQEAHRVYYWHLLPVLMSASAAVLVMNLRNYK